MARKEQEGEQPDQRLPARCSLPGAHARVSHHVPPFGCGGMSSDGQGAVAKAVRLTDPLECTFSFVSCEVS